MNRRSSVLLGMVGVVCLAALPGNADEIDDAAGLPPAEARAALEGLLADTPAKGEDARRGRILRGLAAAHVRGGDLRGAMPHLEAALALDGQDVAARLRLGELLLAVAKQNIQGGGLGRSVHPFLRDAVTSLARLPRGADGGLDPARRARATTALAEAHFLLAEHDAALAALDMMSASDLPDDARPGFHDLRARVLYALERYQDAARAFRAAGNPLAAAAAFDAARQPEESIPLYAEAIRAAPSSTFVIDRALTAVRYHKAHAALHGALESVPTPAGVEGLPLLHARAELLEGSGRMQDALPLLRDAAARDEHDPTALVSLGRLLGLLALSGDAVDEDLLDACADAYIAAVRRAPEDEAAGAGLSWIASQDYGRLWKQWRDERITSRCLRVQQALVEAVPEDAWAWGNLGNTLRVLGRPAESLAAYEKARAANPYDPGIVSDQGLALAGAGRLEEALEAYEASVALDAGHRAGRQNAARGLYLAGRLEAAAAHLGAAARTSRAIRSPAGTYRFLIDRTWRASRRPALR